MFSDGEAFQGSFVPMYGQPSCLFTDAGLSSFFLASSFLQWKFLAYDVPRPFGWTNWLLYTSPLLKTWFSAILGGFWRPLQENGVSTLMYLLVHELQGTGTKLRIAVREQALVWATGVSEPDSCGHSGAGDQKLFSNSLLWNIKVYPEAKGG